MTARGAVVQFAAVTKRFGAVTALEDFTLRVEAGEFVTLLGPSGSGKTTALNLLAGFEPLTAGALSIDGREIGSLATEKRNIGMVFQNYSLFPHMTVADNVAFPLRMRRVANAVVREKVERALALVDLAGFGGRMPNQISGGQKQRVAFARAIVFDPQVLLMDEPLSALDLKLRERMQLEIKQYQRQIGCTVLYVTHDQGEALTLSDRIAVLDRHRLRQVGTPLEIYDRPATTFIAGFIGETNILDAARDGTDGWAVPELGIAFRTNVAPASETGPFCVLLRPERIVRLAPAETRPGMVVFPATVADAIFLGDLVRYRMTAAAGRAITLQEHRGSGLPLLPAGAPVTLGFMPDDVRILGREPDAA